MAAGGPGDHPLTDIVSYNLDIYNKNCDSLIREISKFVSLNNLFEMYDWFGIQSPQNSQNDKFEIELREKLQELREKAKNDGWEI
jgi:hypothetical protein